MFKSVAWLTFFGFSISLISLFFLLSRQSEHKASNIEDEEVLITVDVPISDFLSLATTGDEKIIDALILKIDKNWEERYEIMVLETLYFSNDSRVRSSLRKLLEKKAKLEIEVNFDKTFQYIWNKKESYSKDYFEFKAQLHQAIDSKFYKYFSGRADQSKIRLDEVRWGGVLQDGIPPLRNPLMIPANQATYLNDDDIVFGIAINGDVRAYPKRILAWHEMFVDTVGEVPVAGVYCTLCGTVILYKTQHKGINYELGTSGFLYRSNKLMYDKKTQSLWSTLEGEPVIGPLTNKGIQLDFLSVVTTTWGDWKTLHPNTSVLSTNTGHRRDYGEGVAYKNYFSTDELMFTIPKIDTSLKNKDEILSVRLPDVTTENYAISSKFLKKNPIYQANIANESYVVFTDKSGAHRTYFSKGIHFIDYDNKITATDNSGTIWKLQEEQLISSNGKVLERLATHNAFWFGYKAAFPNTILVK
ncbi:DUF3179 domain-containing protein [Maribacter sp. R77961]|uniref:DUF3179 domain-containing protein n=1 Tax=Maribacter sp. R77961 TaxID=3093871 RepID=UPI0037C5F238